MLKRTITTWWLVGAGVIVVGGVLTLISSLALVPHIQDLTYNFTSSTFVPDSYFWTMVSLIVLGSIAMLGGIIAQFVAWIGAVMNTNRLEDKMWFNILLWVGIGGLVLGPFFGLGAWVWWGLMIAYLVAGPDGMAVQPPLYAAPPAPPRTLAPTG